MDFFILVTFVAIAAYTLKWKDEQKRIRLLGSYLAKYQIEKLMETLSEGYLRALGENDPDRREQIWRQLSATELKLCEQFSSFAAGFSKLDAPGTRVSKLPFPLPYACQLFPGMTFDMRKALVIHAQGITRAAENSQNRSPKARAFTMSAELFLMQHSCHWFCKSKAVASARMLVRHKTSYDQLMESVAPETHRAYAALVGG